MSSRMLSIALLFGVSLFAQPALQPYESVEPHMGTLFRIKLYAPDAKTAEAGFHAAFTRIAELDRILSDYQPESELSRVTREPVGKPVRVSDDLFRIVQASQQLSEETGGAFDLTVGPLTQLWRQARRDHALPSSQDLQAALARCGYTKLHVDSAAQTLEFDTPGMLLDAGGIAKGYAADQALLVLKKMGLLSALVAASGDLAFGDAPPGQAGWKIGIDSFDSAHKPFTRRLMLTDAAVSTSGNSEQNLKLQGQTYSHIIDPKSGMGLTDDLTVTTVGSNGITADPAATAISVLGCQKGLAFAERQPKLAVFILDRTGGRVHTVESTHFQSLLHNREWERVYAVH